MSERSIVVSDIHLGSPHLQRDHVSYFMDALPAAVTLILNGDIVDVIHHALPDFDQQILDRLIAESQRRRVVWIYGNHDDGMEMEDAGNIEFARSHDIGQRLHVNHGYDFDNVMPRHRWAVRLFRWMHTMRVFFGAEPVHVAQYAKRWAFLYRYLRECVSSNAIEYALQKGYAAVTCGHTHFVEDVRTDGIRYINTGSWTETPVCYVWVTPGSIELKKLVIGDPIGDA